MKYPLYYKKGFTLFFAVLVSTLALSIGLAIYDLTAREIDLSATVTQSQYAVYAADTGTECALYWDNKYITGTGGCNQRDVSNNCTSGTVFATSSVYTGPATSIMCSGVNITSTRTVVTALPAGTPQATTTFTLTFLPQPYCATVQVVKSGNPVATSIISHGYNTCTAGGLQLERAFQVNY